MSAARNVMQLVERKLEVLDAGERIDRMPEQSTADFFTRDDRKELYKATTQNDLILRDLSDIKSAAKEDARTHRDAIEAHEKRLRALEDNRLELQTQIATSWRWIVLLSAVGGGIVNFLIKLIWK